MQNQGVGRTRKYEVSSTKSWKNDISGVRHLCVASISVISMLCWLFQSRFLRVSVSLVVKYLF